MRFSQGLHRVLMERVMMGGVMLTCVDVGAWGRIGRVRRWVLLLMAVAVGVLVCGCSKSRSWRSRGEVDRVSVAWDPDKLELTKGFDSYVRYAFKVQDCQTGVIEMGDGERVKFWFVSHHRSRDWGCTKFVFADGTVRYLDGAFCCEVKLADERPKDRAALNAFLDTREGINPGPMGS